MICSQTQRLACTLIAEGHEYVLTHVLCFSEFSSVFPIQHKLQLFWIRIKESKCGHKRLPLGHRLNSTHRKSLCGLLWLISPVALSQENWPHKMKPMVLCFHYGEGICQSRINPPATSREGEALLRSPLCYWNPEEGSDSSYLEWGCPGAGWGIIHELGTYKKLQQGECLGE